MKKYLITLATALALAAHADTSVEAIGFHVASHHVPSREFNNMNPGAYVRWDNGLTLGGYYNSERRMSVYAGYTQEWGPFALTMGAVTGTIYGFKRRAVMPMIVPSLRLGSVGPADVRVAVLPKLGKGGATVVHLMLEVRQ